MEALENLIETQLTILILLFLGFLLAKVGLFPTDFRKGVTDLVLNFVLPCNIIKSFMISFSWDVLQSGLAIFLASIGAQLGAFFLGRTIFAKSDPQRHPSLEYATLVSNAGFLGNPIVEGLYGSQGLLYGSIYLIPARILMWSAGVSCFTGGKGKDVWKKTLTHPCIIAVVVGLFFLFTQITLPTFLTRPLSLVSGCNTPLSLMVVGAILAEINPKQILDPEALGYCLLRLVVIPLLVFAGCRLLSLEPLVTQVATILAGMPAPVTLPILASQHGKDEKFAVSMMFLSTVLSMVSVPGLCLLMSLV